MSPFVSSSSRRSPVRAEASRYDPQTSSYLLSKVPREVRLMIWEYVLTGNDLYMYQTRAPLLLERFEPGKKKVHWFPLKSVFLGPSPVAHDQQHAWAIAKNLSNVNYDEKNQGPSITALMRTCKAIYEEAIYLRPRLFTGNHLYFYGTSALEQFCRTVPSAKLHNNTWTIYPDNNVGKFVSQVYDPSQSISTTIYSHAFDDPFPSFANETWSQIDRRLYRKFRTVKILLGIQDFTDQPFPKDTEVRVVFGTLNGVEPANITSKKQFGICFQIGRRGLV